jgi:O-antigen/teichoic acid export membrane protein
METKKFIKEGSVLIIATFIGSAFNYLFNISMGRLLGPADYSIMMSLLSLLMIVSIPIGTVQTVVAKYVTNFHAHNKTDTINSFLYGTFIRIFIFGMFIFVVLISTSKIIANYLNISSIKPVLIVSTVLFPLIFLPAIRGVLQGLQKFYLLGINIVSEGFIRLLCGILLVYAGLGVNGAIASTSLSSLFALLFVVFTMKETFFKKDNINNQQFTQFNEVYKYTGPVLISLLCITALTNMDLIIVKHYFLAEEAGIYSGAEIIGKIVFYLPAPISVFVFPKTAYSHAKNSDTKGILLKGLLFILAITGLLTTLYFIFPDIFVMTFFGERYIKSAPFLGLFGIAMSFYAIVNLLIFYKLSIHIIDFTYTLVGVTLLQIVLLMFFHNTLYHVIYVLIFCSSILMFVNVKDIIKGYKLPK